MLSEWKQVLELFKYQRFWKLATTYPEHQAVNEAIKMWGFHAHDVLDLFAQHDGYCVLSHRVLKFYHELQKTAAAYTDTKLDSRRRTCFVDHTEWKAGYEVIVSTLSVTDHISQAWA